MNKSVKYTCVDGGVSARATGGGAHGAYVDKHIKGYERYHDRFLHPDDALSALHLRDSTDGVSIRRSPAVPRIRAQYKRKFTPATAVYATEKASAWSTRASNKNRCVPSIPIELNQKNFDLSRGL